MIGEIPRAVNSVHLPEIRQNNQVHKHSRHEAIIAGGECFSKTPSTQKAKNNSVEDELEKDGDKVEAG